MPKPADGQPAAVPAADAAKGTAEPAKADDWKLEAPKDVTVDAKDLTAAETFAKANGLTKAQAEKVLARDLELRTANSEAQKLQIKTAEDTAANTFAEQVEKHPELGGTHLPQTIANAKRALTAFATPEERKAILASPFGNHPVLIAILNRAAASLPAEDATALTGAVVPGSEPITTHAGAAKAIYGAKKPS